MVGVSVANLGDEDTAQLVLPLDQNAGLDRAVDDVRERYGTPAVTRATLLGRDRGLEMPRLPD